MIENIKEQGLSSPHVFEAMLKVPREEFLDERYRDSAYEDEPLPIGFGQTISQPFTVAYMTDLLKLTGDKKVLEIGTGSGYQAAILSLLAKKVFTIERIEELANRAQERFERLGYKNITVKVGSGEKGWGEHAPYDAIIVTAGVEEVPQALMDQLSDGGILVVPRGKGEDKIMTTYKRMGDKIIEKKHGLFHFVPFIKE